MANDTLKGLNVQSATDYEIWHDYTPRFDGNSKIKYFSRANHSYMVVLVEVGVNRLIYGVSINDDTSTPTKLSFTEDEPSTVDGNVGTSRLNHPVSLLTNKLDRFTTVVYIAETNAQNIRRMTLKSPFYVSTPIRFSKYEQMHPRSFAVVSKRLYIGGKNKIAYSDDISDINTVTASYEFLTIEYGRDWLSKDTQSESAYMHHVYSMTPVGYRYILLTDADEETSKSGRLRLLDIKNGKFYTLCVPADKRTGQGQECDCGFCDPTTAVLINDNTMAVGGLHELVLFSSKLSGVTQ